MHICQQELVMLMVLVEQLPLLHTYLCMIFHKHKQKVAND